MPNPPRFEGLAEDKITWYSNEEQQSTCGSLGLAEDKITWHSNSKMPRLIGPTVWEAEEITGFSNSTFQPQAGLEGDRITGLSTIVNGQLYWVWKGIGLYGTQTVA